MTSVLLLIWLTLTATATPPKRGRGRPRGSTKTPTVVVPVGRAGLTPAEVATTLAISLSQVYVLLDRGEFVSFHIGSSRRITADSVVAFIERQVAAEGQTA